MEKSCAQKQLLTEALTTKATTAPLAPFSKTKDYESPLGPHLSSMGSYSSEATKSALDSLGF